MSEQDTSVEQIALRMLDNTAEMRRALVNHAEQLRNLNETLAGFARLIENHTAALNSHHQAIELLGRECGITFTAEEPPAAPGGAVH
jgi:hypothetical protein